MAEKFLLEIVTPMSVLLSEEVELVTAPGSDGVFGVLRDHTLMVTPVDPGEVSFVKSGGQAERMAIGSGYVEVLGDKTTLLVDSAVHATDINLSEATAQLSEAEEALASADKEAKAEYKKLADAAAYAKAKVDVAGKSA